MSKAMTCRECGSRWWPEDGEPLELGVDELEVSSAMLRWGGELAERRVVKASFTLHEDDADLIECLRGAQQSGELIDTIVRRNGQVFRIKARVIWSSATDHQVSGRGGPAWIEGAFKIVEHAPSGEMG